jgi:hypothetical protein
MQQLFLSLMTVDSQQSVEYGIAMCRTFRSRIRRRILVMHHRQSARIVPRGSVGIGTDSVMSIKRRCPNHWLPWPQESMRDSEFQTNQSEIMVVRDEQIIASSTPGMEADRGSRLQGQRRSGLLVFLFHHRKAIGRNQKTSK